MKKFLTWLDHNLLTLLAGILVVAVPLYPKIPLGELIEGYIVRLRLEDLLVLFTSLVWLVQTLRGKIKLPQNKITKWIYLYLGVGLLSALSAIFITHTVPGIRAHIFKLAFHWFRRVEYFSLFFIFYSAIRTKRDFQILLKTTFLTLIGVILYGIGQKYFYFPAFSTMNREFSKGVVLYLQPNTRLFSTFGGHYDLAAYLMIALGFTIPAAWLVKNKWHKLVLYLVSLLAYWSLVLTTSRTSFIGYLVAITFVAFLLIKYKGFWWSLKRWFLVSFVSLVLMLVFSNLLERFTQVIPDKTTRDNILAVQQAINQPFVNEPNNSRSVSELPTLLGFLFKNEKPIEIPPEEISEDQLAIVASSSDRPPTPIKPTPMPELPSDVDPESEQYRKIVNQEAGKEEKPGVYSPNALKYGLSMGIRLDVLWPNAIAGLKRNPLLGTGYSTLVKATNDEFTYAESTDNDYLRMLGETGLLGLLTFIGVIYYIFEVGKKLFNSKDLLSRVVSLGVMAMIVSMAVNALYIDVFESSKVAYTFWILAALATRQLELGGKNAKEA